MSSISCTRPRNSAAASLVRSGCWTIWLKRIWWLVRLSRCRSSSLQPVSIRHWGPPGKEIRTHALPCGTLQAGVPPGVRLDVRKGGLEGFRSLKPFAPAFELCHGQLHAHGIYIRKICTGKGGGGWQWRSNCVNAERRGVCLFVEIITASS